MIMITKVKNTINNNNTCTRYVLLEVLLIFIAILDLRLCLLVGLGLGPTIMYIGGTGDWRNYYFIYFYYGCDGAMLGDAIIVRLPNLKHLCKIKIPYKNLFLYGSQAMYFKF